MKPWRRRRQGAFHETTESARHVLDCSLPAEIQAWLTRLKKQEESWFDFGDVDDMRPYAVALIRPGSTNQRLVEVVNKKEKVPARVIVVGGKVVAFIKEEANNIE